MIRISEEGREVFGVLLLYCFASPLSGFCEVHSTMWMRASVFAIIFSFVIFLVTVKWCKVTGDDVLLKSGAGRPHFQWLPKEVRQLWGFSCAAEDSKLPSQHWDSTSPSSALLAEPVIVGLLGCIFGKEGYGGLKLSWPPTVVGRAHRMSPWYGFLPGCEELVIGIYCLP